MRIIIIGAGVLGSRYAAGLIKAGHEVTLLARGQRLADLQNYGIVLEEIQSGSQTECQVKVVENLNPDEVYDLALVIMRSNRINGVLPMLAANLNIPAVVFLGNNIHGPGEMINSLGRDRVLLGFPGAGGIRNGHIIRFLKYSKKQDGVTFLGELNGEVTSRLKTIAGAFEGSGFPAQIIPNIEAWLKYHVALVSPLAFAVYMAGGDNYKLARTRDELVLVVRAVREGFHALQTLRIPITPPGFRILDWIPEPFLIKILSRRMNNLAAEINIAGHAKSARDEMQYLADGIKLLIHDSGIKTPALDCLYLYSNPNQPPLKEGTSQIRLNWRGVWAMLGILAGLTAAITWIVAKLKQKKARL
jgi:2-dehydropantoate 2-reductase